MKLLLQQMRDQLEKKESVTFPTGKNITIQWAFLPILKPATCAIPTRTRISGNPSKTGRNKFFVPKVVPEKYLPLKRSVRGRRGPAATAIAPSFSPHTSHDHNFRCHCTPFAGTTDSSLVLHRSTLESRNRVLLPRSHFQLEGGGN